MSKETELMKCNYRINLLKTRGEMMNEHLIAKLLRQKRRLENEE